MHLYALNKVYIAPKISANDTVRLPPKKSVGLMKEIKIYLVEDSPVIRDSLVAALEDLAPVKVVGCAPDEASASLWLTEQGHACDLVIVDIFLKQGSGLGVLKTLQDRRRELKAIVLSNYATPDIRRRCNDLGADRVFDKSDQIDDLISYCAALSSGEAGNTGLADLN